MVHVFNLFIQGLSEMYVITKPCLLTLEKERSG